MKLLSKLLPFLLCFTTVVAQQSGTVKKLEIRNFKGLNTVSGDFSIQPNEARVAHELDFGANLGSLTWRRGYDSISVIAGMDSILGIYGAYYSDDTQQLFVVADSNGTGYGNVYVTQTGSVNLSADSLTRIWQYWGVQNRPSFTKHNDNVYIVNGQQRGIIWDGKRARSWPPRTPGEPLIVPLNDAGNLDGEYIYRFAINGRGVGGTAYGTAFADGVVSSRIRLNNGKVLLTQFPEPTYDSTGNLRRWISFIDVNTITNTAAYWVTVGDDSAGITSDGSATAAEITDSLIAHFTSDGVDSCTAVDYGNADSFVVKGQYDYGLHGGVAVSANLTLTLDTIHEYRIYRTNANPGRVESTDSVDLIKTFIVNYTDSAFYTDTSYIDNVSDGSKDAPLYSNNFYGRDSAGVLTMRYGAPGYISMDTATGGSTYGILDTVPPAVGRKWGVGYACTFIDTITGIESDTGRSLYVWNDTINHDGIASITIALPRFPANDSGLVLNLYRTHIVAETHDSIVDNFEPYGFWKIRYMADTIYNTPFFLVGQYADTGAVRQVVDTLKYDSLILKREFAKGTPPALAEMVFSLNNRLWISEGSRIWKSRLTSNPTDTLQSWGQADPIDLNFPDGDQTTLIFPSFRGLVRVFSNKSNHNIFQNTDLNWTRVEVSGTHGCIAPYSYARGFGGHYYLSASGVVRETEGQTIDRTQSIELLSASIKSFDNMSLIDKSKSIGFYIDRKYLLHVPAAGTTYVYDERANGWSTWSMAFDGATRYGVETELGFYPGDTMYFFTGNNLFRFGSRNGTDIRTGNFITAEWQSPPLFANSSYQNIQSIGLWSIADSNDYIVRLWPTDHAGTVYDTAQFGNTDIARYRNKSINSNSGLLFKINGTFISNRDVSSATVIDGIDIWYTDEGEVLVE